MTSDGGHSYASQSDTGVIVATKGRRLYELWLALKAGSTSTPGDAQAAALVRS